MYELHRVRLESVGPPKARYDGVTLDLRPEPGDPPCLPSVLWLQNGGGKGVLLKLLFSVLLPNRRETLGAESDTKTLDNMVLSGDTAHIALEWRRVDGTPGAAPLLVTGKVWEWQGGRRSGDSGKLQARFYAFHPVDELLTLDTLPVAAPDPQTGAPRRVPLVRFCEQLGKLGHDHHELGLGLERHQHDWAEHLTRLGLDPELFRYQVRMNRSEGKADEVFKFVSDRQFVDFFLGAILDREEAQALADFVSEYADKLGQRELRMLEADFVSGALGALRPLAEAHAEQQTTRGALRTAYAQASDAAGALAATAAECTSEGEVLARRASKQSESARQLSRIYDEWVERRNELAKVLAEFDLADAQEALEVAERRYRGSRLTARGWAQTDLVSRHRGAVAHRDELAAALDAAETEAEPLRNRRDAAALGLASALIALADAARDSARGAREQARRGKDAAHEADSGAVEQVRKAQDLAGQIGRIEDALREAQAERERLEADGLVRPEEAPAAALARHTDTREQTEARIAAEGQAAADAEERLAEIADESAAQSRLAAELRPRLEGQTAEHAHLSTEAERLATNPTLCELADGGRVELWTAEVQLLEGLRERIRRAERGLIDTELGAVEDRRTVEAVSTDQLLPASRELEVTVGALQKRGLSAFAGWRYLAENVPAERREQVLRACPQLAAGVVVLVPEHLQAAREAIAELRADVRTLITLGDARTLLTGATEVPETIVAPNAGLYDEQVAAEQAERAARRLQRADEIRHAAELELAGLRALVDELRRFLTACPAGHLQALADEVRSLSERLGAAQQAVESLAVEAEALRSRRRQLREELDRLRKALSRAERALPHVERWAVDAEQAERAGAELGQLQAARQAFEAEVRRLRTQAAQLRDHAAEVGRQADGHEARAEQLSAGVGDLHGLPEHIEPQLPVDDLDVLRKRYEVAEQTYRQQTSESDLTLKSAEAEAQAAHLHGEVSGLSAEVRERAERLLADHPGADRAARRSLTGEAEAAEQTAMRALTQAETARDRAHRIYQESLPAGDRRVHVRLPEELTPTDREHAQALVVQATGERDKANAELGAMRAAGAETARQAEAAERQADSLRDYAASLSTAVAAAREQFDLQPFDTTGARYDGTVEEARALRTQLTEALGAATTALGRATSLTGTRTTRVMQYARDTRFAALAGARIIARLSDDSPEQIAADAQRRVEELSQRGEQLERILAEIDQHRDGLIRQLDGLVQNALGALRAAGRASRLPEGLDDWSGREFVRVDFTTPDSEQTMYERLGEVLDESASGRADRDALGLVLRGVHAAVRPTGGGGGGFRVTILKPDQVLENVRVPIAEMSVFSGGQRLTAAIALYCTMAQMRATERGRSRGTRTGALLLDNPLGTANAEYLLNIQLRVAQALGVQLIYTTGINDLNALSMFGRLVPLRNDADLRRGLRYVHVVPELLEQLRGGRELSDEQGYLSAATLAVPRAAEDDTAAGAAA
jgi:hypothetical protein